jgi:hypothetical protein
MKTVPLFRHISMVLPEINFWLQKVYRYHIELNAYSDRTDEATRITDVENSFFEINRYCLECADAQEVLPPKDVRLLYGLWRRLDEWENFLSQQKPDLYLVFPPDETPVESVIHYLLQPRTDPCQSGPVYLLNLQQLQELGWIP